MLHLIFQMIDSFDYFSTLTTLNADIFLIFLQLLEGMENYNLSQHNFIALYLGCG